MSRDQVETIEVWVDTETREYSRYFPREQKPNKQMMPEMEYVSAIPAKDWNEEEYDKVILADRVKRGWETEGSPTERKV